MRTILLIGRPGSGKGTLGERMAKHFGIPVISSGDLVREQIKNNTAIGEQCQQAAREGKLVADEIICALVAQKIKACPNGYILDGFPRSVKQAQYLFAQNSHPHQVVWIDVAEDECLKRITGRRVDAYGVTYNIHSDPPPVDKQVTQRVDDTAEVVRVRFQEFDAATEPLLDLYREQVITGLIELLRVAHASTAENFAQISNATAMKFARSRM